jgi:GMP synthase-like glutamine amidotransferase
MHLGILEAGRPPAPLDETHGRYPAMFDALLRAHLPDGSRISSWPVIDGAFPDSVVDCDAWLITGSAYGVYDHADFIPRLMDFVRAAAEAGVPLVGICFGHQIVAQALGGRAEKSDRGWGVGAHRYPLHHTPAWPGAPEAGTAFDTYVSHQDQVTAPPPGATVLGGSDFCPYAMMAVGETILTLQSHPEMPSAYVRDLYTARRPRIGDGPVDAALQTVADGPRAPDADRVAGWIADFLSHALERQAA